MNYVPKVAGTQMYVARDGGSATMLSAAFAGVTLEPDELRRMTRTAEPRIVAGDRIARPG